MKTLFTLLFLSSFLYSSELLCSSKTNEYWNDELNNTYQKVIQNIDPDHQEDLKQTQQFWLKYRERECQRIHTSSCCYTKLSKDRAEDLKKQLPKETTQYTPRVIPLQKWFPKGIYNINFFQEQNNTFVLLSTDLGYYTLDLQDETNTLLPLSLNMFSSLEKFRLKHRLDSIRFSNGDQIHLQDNYHPNCYTRKSDAIVHEGFTKAKHFLFQTFSTPNQEEQEEDCLEYEWEQTTIQEYTKGLQLSSHPLSGNFWLAYTQDNKMLFILPQDLSTFKGFPQNNFHIISEKEYDETMRNIAKSSTDPTAEVEEYPEISETKWQVEFKDYLENRGAK